MKKIKNKQIFALLMAAIVMVGTVIPVNAANADVYIEVQATTMEGVSLTVPSELPIVFNEDGTNTIPSNWTIENNSSIAGIHLSSVYLVNDDGTWCILDEGEDATKIPADSQIMKFAMGEEGNLIYLNPDNAPYDPYATATFEADDFVVEAGEQKVMKFLVERGAYTHAISPTRVFEMGLEFDFN